MTISILKSPSVSNIRLLFVVVFCLFIPPLCAVSVFAETTSSTPVTEVTFQDDLISAKLVDAPLIEVLQQLKREYGFKAHFHGDLSEKITLSFTDLPLDRSLQQLTAGHSLSVVSKTNSELEQNESRQIAEVWVLSRSTTSTARKTPPPPPGAQTKPSPAQTDETVMPQEQSLEQPEITGQENISLEQVLNDPDAERNNQLQAIQQLINIGDSASVIAMAAFLDNQDKEIRQMLVNGISSINSAESTQVLGQVLQTEADPEIRMIALRALSQRKSDEAARSFLENARDDMDEEVRNLAHQVLAE
ncbi:MAG: HEAT repeat domain-containing protein [Desulforhopalus sp.]